MTIIIIVGVLAALAVLAVYDLTQRQNAVTRNFPVVGHLRALFEELGHPLRQYFFAGDLDERPYNRVTRTWVYASANGQSNLVGFGSQVDHNAPGRMLIVPSMYPTLARAGATAADLPRPGVIGAKRPQPYQPRRFANISGMSYGALSSNAVRALSRGAKMADCYMSTGEGSLTPYHLEGDCDVLYQIGPAKFGCRTPEGRFDDEKAAAILALPQVKMVEIKLSQGAKPGQGGLLPKAKITEEIAEIRGIPIGVDCQSPNRFEEFDDAPSLLDFIERVRKLTGKPVGLKMVVGSTDELDELCREIRKRGDGPDFIAVDGAEGGSGATPLALADQVGMPLVDALVAVDNALRRAGVRHEVSVIASGKIATGGEAALHLALGADLVHIGRGFLMSIGCIQAMRCHTNTCPTGVATQNKWLQAGLDPADKGVRAANYALAIERDIQMISNSCGVASPRQLHRGHIVMNVSPGVKKSLVELYPYPSDQFWPPAAPSSKEERERQVSHSVAS
ncbi:MAG: FMN-binding glutamate synthase family protein [Acidobacteriota bacterium]